MLSTTCRVQSTGAVRGANLISMLFGEKKRTFLILKEMIEIHADSCAQERAHFKMLLRGDQYATINHAQSLLLSMAIGDFDKDRRAYARIGR